MKELVRNEIFYEGKARFVVVVVSWGGGGDGQGWSQGQILSTLWILVMLFINMTKRSKDFLNLRMNLCVTLYALFGPSPQLVKGP